MSTPFYVSPEQLIKDRADFARKGIARGRSVVVLGAEAGIVLVAENPSTALRKIAEIYDRIGFAAVGKYNEFEQLRQAGVRYADLRGYSYDRTDVSARGLTNAYAQTLAGVFTTESKPLEVELVVAELGAQQAADQLYRISYDGSVADESDWVSIGGGTERIAQLLSAEWSPGLSLPQAVALGRKALGASREGTVEVDSLEVALLDRAAPGRRTFRRIGHAELAQLLAPERGEPGPQDEQAGEQPE
ncbi:proteasome subunit alpha [Sediminivirga luteola]|uniref:Proteasome subunit alpha n=1 Tax=Sediminivirga luteola TaxID=1774748 RepID=A0A8J2TWY9_9MICO|nr:proteasome subunit alpha [Sediminivirga luteola]MCI2263933.1 proteasome subunit alpha [Sediminivirga luteola]GGA08784.1 proteasome subunit alpha [Sediminivirga luteola]